MTVLDGSIKTAIIFAGILIVAIVGISAWLSTLETGFEPNSTQSETQLQTTTIDKSRFKKAPKIVGIAEYINTTPEELEKEIENKVVLYDIWTYSCINCVRTLPYITAWNEKYSDEGLLIIGIHSPEFEFEKDLNNVKMAVDKHGITYPVVLDNDWETWKAFENRYWPRKYISDNEGYIRYDHIGEGAYQETEKVIQQLLKERAMNLGLHVASAQQLVDLEEFEHSSFRTPELYFGYKFAQGRNQLGNSEGFNPNRDVAYTIPEKLEQHNFYLQGTWTNLEGSMKLVSNSGIIKLPYHAKEVNIVTANPATIRIELDGVPLPPEYRGFDISDDGILNSSEDGLYNIIKSDSAASHLLEIYIEKPGFEIYTFTFG